MFSCLDAGDEVIIPEPLYANYIGFGRSREYRGETDHCFDRQWLCPASHRCVPQQITDKTKAILICNPNNPTGYLYSKEELEQLRQIVLEHDLFSLPMKYIVNSCTTVPNTIPYSTREGLDEHVVLMDSISKRYSACGARIGALVTRNAKVMETALKFAQARLSPPTIEQILAEAFYRCERRLFHRCERRIRITP